jgi:chitin disaccharide deacetylase
MHKIIICADDYGLTASVNRAIEACLSAGAVQSTCIMPNMEFADAGKSLPFKHPNASLGLHWTLTMGRPMVSANNVSSLVDQKGNFHTFGEFRKRLRAKSISLNEVQLELRAQLDCLQASIGTIEFWNSHQNIHLWPGLFQLFVALALDAGIRKMRCNSRITLVRNRLGYNLRNIEYLVKGKILDFWSYNSRKKGMLMPHGLIAMPGAGPGKTRLEEYLRRYQLPNNKTIVEASLHPADEAEHPNFGKLSISRYKEYLLFSDGDIRSRLLELGVDCVSFGDLAA